MKKMIALTVCTMLTLSVCSCGTDKKILQDTSETAKHETVTTSDVTMTDEDPIGMPNPFIEGSLEECIKLAGFDFAVPDHFGNYPKRSILAIEGNLIEAIYSDEDLLEGLDDDALNELDWETIDFDSDSLMIRKVLEADSADISGDYTTYEETNHLTINGFEITTRGNDGKIYDALWNNETYSYAIVSSNGITTAELTDLVAQIQ